MATFRSRKGKGSKEGTSQSGDLKKFHAGENCNIRYRQINRKSRENSYPRVTFEQRNRCDTWDYQPMRVRETWRRREMKWRRLGGCCVGTKKCLSWRLCCLEPLLEQPLLLPCLLPARLWRQHIRPPPLAQTPPFLLLIRRKALSICHCPRLL